MSMIREALRGVAVLAASAVCVGAACAQDGDPNLPPPNPREVVEHCLQEMGDITRTTLDAIHDRTEHGIAVIIDLAQNGAEPPQIVHAGQMAKGACTMAARRGQDALNATLERCLGVLREIEAPREAFGVLIEARRRAGLAIGDALTRCKRHINHAVARALGAHNADEPTPVSVVPTGAALTE